MDDEIIVKNARFIKLKTIVDGIDGTIAVAENFKHIPFEIKRTYYIYNFGNPKAVRGKHAHKTLEQVLFCINGRFEIGLDDGENQQAVILETPDIGIYLGIELWHTMKKFSDNCILLALASDVYDENDYIRDYDRFIDYIATKRNTRLPGKR